MADDQGDGVAEDDGKKKGSGQRTPTASDNPNDDVLTAKKPDIWASTQKSAFSLQSAGGKKQEAIEPDPKAASTFSKKDALAEQKKAAEQQDTKSTSKKNAKDKVDSKKVPDAKSPKRGKDKNPERYWVQVATGAYKPDLGKAWDKLKEKYPAMLKRRSAWTTPMNRTNRVLIGPFSSSEEAQAFVNKAAGSGLATSRFTSPAGQAVEPIS